MNVIKKIVGGDSRQLGMIFALIALIAFFQWRTGGLTLTPDNVNNIIQGNAYVLVLAIGMVLVIIAGHIDLSVGSIAAFVGIVVALAITDWGLPWPVAILLGIGVGALWRLAGPLGRLRRHPRVHRDPGRHAHLPRPQPVDRQVQHRPRPRGLPVIGAGSLPEWGPNTGYNNLTLLLGLAGCAAIIVGALRSRAKLTKISAPTSRSRGSCGRGWHSSPR